MTELEDAMSEHMAFIVHMEHRPFCYKDFLCFEMNGKQYKMIHGTFRNKILKLMQKGEVEIHTKSNPCFYTLKGQRFGNSKVMTDNHMEGISVINIIKHPIYRILDSTPFDERALHNLHLTFEANGIYKVLIKNPPSKAEFNSKNKGISVKYPDIDKFSIIVTIYPTNTCKLVIGCSEAPIFLDFKGINQLSNALCRIEERLSYQLLNTSIKVPLYKDWIIKLWHIGKDSLSEYSKKMFQCKFNIFESIVCQIYAKEFQNCKRKVRIEVQQNPNISVNELLIQAIIKKILE